MEKACLKKSVLLYAPVETFDLTRGPAAFTLDLCGQHGFNMTGMILNTNLATAFNPIGLTYAQLAEQSDQLDAQNAANLSGLKARCRASGIDFGEVATIDHSRGFFPFVCDHARLHDLTICGSDDTGMLNERLVCEALLFDSGRPILLVPHGHAGGCAAKSLAVAWDNSRSAARAMGDALALLPGIEAVTFLVVGDEKTIVSSIDPAEQVRTLSRRGLKVSIERIAKGKRGIGVALQEAAVDAGADLLAMGAYGHSRLREFILGGATFDVLHGLRLPVLMAH